jgi:glycosyltransferase involved in cell wall biosynthesis
MTRLSIVHLTTFLQGGAGRAITDLACAQRAAGHRVQVVSSSTGEPGYENYPHYLERLRQAGVTLLLVDSLFKREAALNLRVLDRMMAANPPGSIDIIHAHAGTPARIGLAYAETSGAAVIQTQHGWSSNKTAEQAHEDLETLCRVDRVVVTSEATLTLLIELGVPSERMLTIPCGLPPEGGPIPQEAKAAVASLRARGHRIVGCVGTINANKNQQVVLEALSRLSDVAGIFVGESGEALQRRARLAGLEDRVLVPGYQPDADRWIAAFDLLAVPSFTEGQGLVVLEAFRAGVPVVASDIAPLRQMVVPGHTGWLFDPRSAGSVAGAIERALALLPDERDRMTARARRWFQESYTIDRMVARHNSLYERVLAVAGSR